METFRDIVQEAVSWMQVSEELYNRNSSLKRDRVKSRKNFFSSVDDETLRQTSVALYNTFNEKFSRYQSELWSTGKFLTIHDLLMVIRAF
jgi:hypothetical protein